MFLRFLYPLGLRKHALIVSGSLLFLVVLLGARAFSVASAHRQEISDLVNHDLLAEGLLVRMEASASSRDQARRKLRITQDPAYFQLVAHHEETLKSTAEALQLALLPIYPQFADRVPHLRSALDMRKMRDELNSQREGKLQRAHSAALGLYRLIMIAFVLSIVIMAWLVHLFYRGLLDPLKTLKEATSRIKQGELTYRMSATRQGVMELRELAQSFNEMAERLDALEKSKTEFLATVSHEVKNPLAALKEGLNLLATQGDNLSPTARSKGFAACLIASKRLEFMINNMLHHSKMEAGLYKFDLRPKNLSEAIKTAVDEVRPMADRKGMTIQMTAPSELEASFNWDGMVQVFENLLLNAIKYGSENSSIEVQAQPTQRPLRDNQKRSTQPVPHVEVSVMNSGAKVAEAELPRLFDRFYRGGNSGQQQGLGLGLHVVRKIIEAHHGEVAASSVADGDQGKTRIQLWIPGRYESGLESGATV